MICQQSIRGSYIEEIVMIEVSQNTWTCLSSRLKLQLLWQHTREKEKLGFLVTLQSNMNTCSKKRGPAAPIPEKTVRHDGFIHMSEVLTDKGRCKLPNCTGIVRTKCTKCNVFLCLTSAKNCYGRFHEIWRKELTSVPPYVFPYLRSVMPNGNKARTHHRLVRIGKEFRHLLLIPERLWENKKQIFKAKGKNSRRRGLNIK